MTNINELNAVERKLAEAMNVILDPKKNEPSEDFNKTNKVVEHIVEVMESNDEIIPVEGDVRADTMVFTILSRIPKAMKMIFEGLEGDEYVNKSIGMMDEIISNYMKIMIEGNVEEYDKIVEASKVIMEITFAQGREELLDLKEFLEKKNSAK